MNITGIGAYGAVSQSVRVPQRAGVAVQGAENGTLSAKTDTAEISDEARQFIERIRERKQETPESGELTLDSDDMREIEAAAKSLEQNSLSVSETEAEEAGSESGKGSMGINAAKLARKLAAAKTQSQIRAIMAEIQSDLRECESGKAQGMDVDEASVEAAERLLQEARQRMGQAENREPTPEEETASALASLF